MQYTSGAVNDPVLKHSVCQQILPSLLGECYARSVSMRGGDTVSRELLSRASASAKSLTSSDRANLQMWNRVSIDVMCSHLPNMLTVKNMMEQAGEDQSGMISKQAILMSVCGVGLPHVQPSRIDVLVRDHGIGDGDVRLHATGRAAIRERS